MKRTRTVITVVAVLIGVVAGASVAAAQTPPPPPPPPTPAPAGATVDAEPEHQTSVITTAARITATVLDATGEPVPNAQVFWTESGVGEIREAETQTDENGEAEAKTASNTPGEQIVTAWLDPPPQNPSATDPCAADPPRPPEGEEEPDEPLPTQRCDDVFVTWVARQPTNQPALECSGGALALGTPIGDFGEIPYEEAPCPVEGTEEPPEEADPTVVEEELLDIGIAELAGARREFGSSYTLAESRVVGVELGGLIIEVASSFARSECSPNGIATQEQDSGVIVIRQEAGVPGDPSDDDVIFNGQASPNTTVIPGVLFLNEQESTVEPEFADEKQDRHAEGTVTAVRLVLGPLEFILARSQSDITCKPHAFAIDLEPEEQTAEVGSQATVTATVRDEAGRPVPGENVEWSETGEGEFVSQETTTDENGQADAVLTSNTEGDQQVTATLSEETTKCEVAEGGICSDTVVIHWEEDVEPPVTTIRVTGHAHTDYDGDNKVHVTKNDRGDVHIGALMSDNPADNRRPEGRLGYWDLRPDPPGPANAGFRCERFVVETMTLQTPNRVQFTGLVNRCFTQAQTAVVFHRFRLIIQDNGPNPPNRDAYQMTFFNRQGQVVYQWADFTTVGLGDLKIEVLQTQPQP